MTREKESEEDRGEVWSEGELGEQQPHASPKNPLPIKAGPSQTPVLFDSSPENPRQNREDSNDWKLGHGHIGSDDNDDIVIVSDVEEDDQRESAHQNQRTNRENRPAGSERTPTGTEGEKSGNSGEEMGMAKRSGVYVDEDVDSVIRDTKRIEAEGKNQTVSAAHSHRIDDTSRHHPLSFEPKGTEAPWTNVFAGSEHHAAKKGQKSSNQGLEKDNPFGLFSDEGSREPKGNTATRVKQLAWNPRTQPTSSKAPEPNPLSREAIPGENIAEYASFQKSANAIQLSLAEKQAARESRREERIRLENQNEDRRLGARPKTYARGGKVSRFDGRERFNGKDWERTSEDEQDPRNIPFPLLGDEHGPISYPPTATPKLRVPSIAAPEEDSPIQPWRMPPSELKMRQLGMVVRRQANEVDRRLLQKVEEVGQRATRASRKYGIEADLRSHGRMEVARKTIAFYEEKRLEREEAHQAQEEHSNEIALRALNSMQIVVDTNQRNYEKYEGSLDCVKDTGKQVLDELLKEIMRVNSQGIERAERAQGKFANALQETSTLTAQARHPVKVAADKQIADLRSQQAAARARNEVPSQSHQRSRLRLPLVSPRLPYVSGQFPRRPFSNLRVDDRYGQPFNPDHYCEYHRSNGHRTTECRGLLKKQGYYDALSGEPSFPPPLYPQYPAMVYRVPGQNGAPYGHNRPFNPAVPPFNLAIPPLNPAIPPFCPAIPETSREEDRSALEVANRRIGASTRTRPWGIDPNEPVEERGRTARRSPTEQFEELKRRYEECDLNVLEAEVGRKKEYPAPVLRPTRWNSSAPDNQKRPGKLGKNHVIPIPGSEYP